MYSNADVLFEKKMKIFPIILKAFAFDYYYSNISTGYIAIHFNQVNNSSKNYFKDIEYKQIFS